jgi:hypothetical protein
MYLRPGLRKGDVEIRIKAPKELVAILDAESIARGVDRQAVVLVALDRYVEELTHVSRLVDNVARNQRTQDGNKTATQRRTTSPENLKTKKNPVGFGGF